MRVLIFGLPGSGKTTLAKGLAKRLPCLYLNADVIRELFKDDDFSMQGRIHQAKRMRALADMAPNILVIADFVCPTKETRKIFNADITIWMNTTDHCPYANTNKIFEIPKKVDYIITTKDAKKHAKEIGCVIATRKTTKQSLKRLPRPKNRARNDAKPRENNL